MDRNNLLKEIKNLDDGWTLIEHALARDFTFKNFNAALDFINRIGKVFTTPVLLTVNNTTIRSD